MEEQNIMAGDVFSNELLLEKIFKHFEIAEQIQLTKVCRQFHFTIRNKIWKKHIKYLVIKSNKFKKFSITILDNLEKPTKKYCINFSTQEDCEYFLNLNKSNVIHIKWDGEEALWREDADNQEESVGINPIDYDFENLQKLTWIGLSGGLLNKIIKSFETNCSRLKELVAFKKNIYIPKDITDEIIVSNIKGFTSLTLGYGYFINIEEFCKLLRNLKYLNIEENVDIRLIGEEQQQDRNTTTNYCDLCIESPLETLKVSENHIDLIINNPLLNATRFENLKELYVSCCADINSDFLKTISQKFPHLYLLSLSDSTFSTSSSHLPKEMLHLQELREVHLESSEGITYKMIQEFLSSFQLKKLNLYESIITEDISVDFSTFSKLNYSLESLSIGFEDECEDRLMGTQQFWFRLLELPHINIVSNLQELVISHCWNYFSEFLNLFTQRIKKLKSLDLEFTNLSNVNLMFLENLEKLKIHKCYNYNLWTLLQQISYLSKLKELSIEMAPFSEQISDLKAIPSSFPKLTTINIPLEVLSMKRSSLVTSVSSDFLKFLELNFINKIELNLSNSALQCGGDINLIKEIIVNKNIHKNLKSVNIYDYIVVDFSTLFAFLFDPLVYNSISEFTFGDCKIDLSWSVDKIKEYIFHIADDWSKSHFTMHFTF